MIKVGITGGSGFIGTHLKNWLSLNKKEFKIIDFKKSFFDNNSLLDNFVKKSDVIVHLSGINRHNDEKFIYSSNIDMAKKIISSFERTQFKGKLIFSSSIQEKLSTQFGKSKKRSRLLFESWCSNNDILFHGLIIPNVFGPFCKPNYNSFISTFSHNLINNKKSKILVDNNVPLIYIDNLIFKIFKLFKTKKKSKKIKINQDIEIKVSEVLLKLKNFKSEYILNHKVPKLESKFDLNLFNTFRSYFNYDLYPIVYKNNIDVRGNFVELIRENTGGQFSYSITKPQKTRGNHFHTRKIERFSVLKGKALIEFRKYGCKKKYSFKLDGEEPSFIDMPLWYTHNIKNIGNEDLITSFWINEHYNEIDSDTYYEDV